MQSTSIKRLDEIRSECRKMVSQRALLSAAAAVVPVPGVDFGTDVAILMKIIPQINARFGLGPTEVDSMSPELQKLIIVGGTTMGLGLVGRVLTTDKVVNVLLKLGAKKLAGKYGAKYIPIIGTAISSTISYVVLRKVGHAHIEECYELARRLSMALHKPSTKHHVSNKEVEDIEFIPTSGT